MSDIDRLLRRDARLELPDDGFTARVMGELPARLQKGRAWLRPALVMGSATIGSALAVVLSPQSGALVEGFADLMRLHAASPAAITALAICGALLVSGLVLATESE